MPNVTANGIQIEYETFGDKDKSPILLIIGISTQLIAWDVSLCEKLANAGHYIVIFDNRDIGLSSKLEDAGIPDVMAAVGNFMSGKPVNAPYTYDEMADDAVGLLDALGIKNAHICGQSMGAAIAQTIAIRHPQRTTSLISIYGSTGNPELPPPAPYILQILTTPIPEEREAWINQVVENNRLFHGSGFPFDEKWHRNLAERSYDRNFYPDGFYRQLLAGIAHGNRKPALTKLRIPALVIHGAEDPLVPVEAGKDTAEAIPNAELMLIEGMGHDMPKLGGAWDQITDRIIEFTKQNEV